MSGPDFDLDVDGSAVDKTSGTFLLSDIVSVADACKNGDWMAAGLYAGAGTLDAVATASDPFGSLISAGLGWLMDHFEPLKGWLNDLTGDAEAVEGYATGWDNVSIDLSTQAARLERIASDDFADMNGAGVRSYQKFATGLVKDLDTASASATGVAEGVRQTAALVSLVHSIVRDVIADLVGSAISWAGEILFSLGTATGWVIEQVSTRVAALAAKVGAKVKALVTSVKALKSLLSQLDGLLSRFKALLRMKAPQGKAPTHRRGGPPLMEPRPWHRSRKHVPDPTWKHPTPQSVSETVGGETMVNQAERAQDDD